MKSLDEPSGGESMDLVPQKVMEENADRVEAKALGPRQLSVDRDGIECIRLPHLQLHDILIMHRWRGEVEREEWTWLMAFDGMKLHPTIQGRALYHLE